MHLALTCAVALATMTAAPRSPGETANARIRKQVDAMNCRRYQGETKKRCRGPAPMTGLKGRVKDLGEGRFELKLGLGARLRLSEPELAYLLVGKLPELGAVLFYVSEDEESGTFLIVRLADGQRSTLRGEPLLAPDARHLVSLAQDFGEGSGEAEIWKVSPEGLTKEWTHQFKREIPSEPKWLNSDTLQLNLVPTGGRPRKATIQLARGGWELERS